MTTPKRKGERKKLRGKFIAGATYNGKPYIHVGPKTTEIVIIKAGKNLETYNLSLPTKSKKK